MLLASKDKNVYKEMSNHKFAKIEIDYRIYKCDWLVFSRSTLFACRKENGVLVNLFSPEERIRSKMAARRANDQPVNFASKRSRGD